MLRITLLAAAAALTLGACSTSETATASNEPPAGRDCFNQRSVSSYSINDDDKLDVRVGANRHYLVTLQPNPRDLDFTRALRLESPLGWICTGNGRGVEIVGGNPPEVAFRYYATNIERGPDENPGSQEGS
jgi:hypothetical protein